MDPWVLVLMQTHQADDNRQGGRGQGEKNRLTHTKKITAPPHTIMSSDFEVPRLSLLRCVTGDTLLGLSESVSSLKNGDKKTSSPGGMLGKILHGKYKAKAC